MRSIAVFAFYLTICLIMLSAASYFNGCIRFCVVSTQLNRRAWNLVTNLIMNKPCTRSMFADKIEPQKRSTGSIYTHTHIYINVYICIYVDACQLSVVATTTVTDIITSNNSWDSWRNGHGLAVFCITIQRKGSFGVCMLVLVEWNGLKCW